MNKLFKKVVALGMSIVLICGNGTYCYAEEESRTDEIVTNSESDFDSENIVNIDQIDRVKINVNDKSAPEIADEKIESESGLSITGNEIGAVSNGENVPTPYSDLPENTDPNNAYGVRPNTEYAGNIVNADEVRWYAFDIAQKSKVSILAMPNAELDTDIFMFQLNFDTMQLTPTGLSAAAEGKGVEDYFSYVMDAGTYFFAIAGYAGTGAYVFDFFANADYVDGEINDTMASAQGINCSEDYSGLIDTVRDRDYYKITLNETTFVQVSFASQINYAFQWVFTEGKEMISAYENQTYALTAGTHYFVIYSQQHEFSLNGRYTVNLRAISNEEMYNTAPSSAYANWNYTLDDANNTITLNYYTGSKKDVIVYNNYEVNGKLYKTKIASNPSSKTNGYMFAGKSNIGTIKFGNHIDTSDTTDMSCMFYRCSGLFDLDVSNLDTSKVTNMYQMFYNCASITKFDLLNWDTSNVTNMKSMFEGCSSLTLLVSYMDTSKVTTMERMFMGCMSYTSMDLSYFKTGNVRNMFRMFKDCISLRYVNLDLFDTRQVRTFGYMFQNCYSLTSLDLRSFYLNGVPQRGDMSYMFCNCRSLPVIYVNNAWRQKLDSPIYNINQEGMFYGSPAVWG